MPYAIDPEQVSADFKDGVLKVVLPKPPGAVARAQGRKIEINKPATSGGSSSGNERAPNS